MARVGDGEVDQVKGKLLKSMETAGAATVGLLLKILLLSVFLFTLQYCAVMPDDRQLLFLCIDLLFLQLTLCLSLLHSHTPYHLYLLL